MLKMMGAWMNPGAVLGIRLGAMLLHAVRAFEIVVCGVALGPGQKDTWLCEGGADGRRHVCGRPRGVALVLA